MHFTGQIVALDHADVRTDALLARIKIPNLLMHHQRKAIKSN